jgi:hypothetical protein
MTIEELQNLMISNAGWLEFKKNGEYSFH